MGNEKKKTSPTCPPVPAPWLGATRPAGRQIPRPLFPPKAPRAHSGARSRARKGQQKKKKNRNPNAGRKPVPPYETAEHPGDGRSPCPAARGKTKKKRSAGESLAGPPMEAGARPGGRVRPRPQGKNALRGAQARALLPS
ncbi:hypothetical protein LSM04_001347 [Trypanosoma melophagium]|uniref:uncharacterized protein n=1 Tax=Trypanosoma melophagium TaxID=715481 RepID=UPI00351A8372|nr:hypothetical protein LSM04_001347 [Trypanosoma melophagium]